jgi:YhcH/YjgK/YiaL family protein
MIKDSMKYIEKYRGLGENISLAIDYLIKTDFSKLSPGRYEINGDMVFASVSQYETRMLEQGKWEAHKKYLDIQYIVEGNELIGYTSIDNLEKRQDYDETRDIFFAEGDGGDYLQLKKGDFAVFWPEDAHMPCIAAIEPSMVKKVVIKVRV